MKKVQFDKDGKLIGIGLKDNLIYKKKEYDWRKSKWNRQHKGFDKVYDVFHDSDGFEVIHEFRIASLLIQFKY